LAKFGCPSWLAYLKHELLDGFRVSLENNIRDKDAELLDLPDFDLQEKQASATEYGTKQGEFFWATHGGTGSSFLSSFPSRSVTKKKGAF
jgi:hypothetical protein